MVLDAKANNLLRISNLSNTINRSQVLSLEGDFDSYFTLYAPEQYKRDALYVFTPDVMAALIDHGKEYDIEIVDDMMYFYSSTPFALDAPEQYERTLAIIDTIRDELVDQAGYYADERVGNREMNTVAMEGQRLKMRISFVTAVTIAIVIYIQIIHPILFH